MVYLCSTGSNAMRASRSCGFFADNSAVIGVGCLRLWDSGFGIRINQFFFWQYINIKICYGVIQHITYLNMNNYTDKRTGIVYTNIGIRSASSRSASSRSASSRSDSAYDNADHLDAFIPPAFLKTYFGKD